MDQKDKLSLNIFILLIFVAFSFSIGVRYIWVDYAQNNENYKWNNQLMINTNDGYVYAEGARDMLQGFHQENDLSYYGSSLSTLTYILAKIVPVSFETLILWMPAVFASMLVIPILLIARVLSIEYVGFTAALLGSIAWSYYNRTMVGYYDTDMLTIVLPTFVLWSLIYNIYEHRNRYLFLIPLFLILSQWWYPQSYSINIAFIGTLFLYTLVFDRKNIFLYKIIVFMLIAVALLNIWIKVGILIGLFLLFHFKKELINLKIVFIIGGLAFLLVLLTGGFTPILSQLSAYVFREAVAAETFSGFKYFNVAQTVREAGNIPFETFANRISGHTSIFLLSVIGYILLSIKYRVMWLALPMVGLGFLALKGGLRFTVYAVPIMALGMGYLIFFVSEKFKWFIKKENVLYTTQIVFITASIVAVLYPNIEHIKNYKVPTVFAKPEVAILDKFKSIADREDYVVTWWDFGYPIRYYSDVKTLIDGGKHGGRDNYPVSFTLTHDQVSGANMARLAVEYTERSYKEKLDFNLVQIVKDYNFRTLQELYQSLQDKQMKLPEKTRDIYLYLPDRLINIFSTVNVFSNLNIVTGEQFPNNFFYANQMLIREGDFLYIGNSVHVSKDLNKVKVGKKTFPVNQSHVVWYDENGNLLKASNTFNTQSPLSLIYMKDYKRFIVLDNKMLNSTFIQLYVFENYDKDLYEPVVTSPYTKIYKLKK